MRRCIVLFIGRIVEVIAMFCSSIAWLCMAVEEPALKWIILTLIMLIGGGFIQQFAEKKFEKLGNTAVKEEQNIVYEVVKEHTTWILAVILGITIAVMSVIFGKYIIYTVCALITAMIGILGVIIAIIKLYKGM